MRSFSLSFRSHYEYTIILFSFRYEARKSIILLAFPALLSSKSILFKIYLIFIRIVLQLSLIIVFLIKVHMQVIHIIADNILPFLVLTRLSFCDQSEAPDYATVCILKMMILRY